MRIAIVRLTSLGDVVHTLPVAHALRRYRPGSYIIWIVEEREQALLVDNPAVDEVVVAATRRWRQELRTPAGAVKAIREFSALRHRLRSLELNVAIEVQGLLKSTIFTVLTGAPVRIGFGWRHARDPLSSIFMTHRVAPPPGAAHIVEKNLSLLGPLGITPDQIAFPLPAFRGAERKVDILLQQYHVPGHDRLVVLIPATRRPSKQWPSPRYREVAERVARGPGVRVLLLGGPGEEGLLRSIARDLDGRCIPLPTMPISELVVLLRRAYLAVGNDTGPLHLAAALGVSTIGLYGPTSAARNGPYGPRVRAIESATGRIEDISVGEVLRAVTEWLD